MNDSYIRYLENLLRRIREDLEQRADRALATRVRLSDELYAELVEVTKGESE